MRRLKVVTVSVAIFAALALPAARADAAPKGDVKPVPIPGGIQIPDGPLIHVLAPGPEGAGLMGLDVEPGTITNFRGSTALAFIGGSATDAAGNTYDMEIDVRAFKGEYVSSDGTHHRGTFGFI